MYLQNSVYNHCHPVKRSEDVTMEVAAVPSLFNHPHNTLHDNQERQVEGNTLWDVGRQPSSDWGFPISQLSSPSLERGIGQVAVLTVRLPAPVDWQMSEDFMQLGDQGCLTHFPCQPQTQLSAQRASGA